MVKKYIEHFDLRKIMNSGQIFRMYEPEEGHFVVYSGDKRLELFQSGKEEKAINGCCPGREVRFMCTADEFEEYWEGYFDLKRDYRKIMVNAEKLNKKTPDRGTEFLAKACEYGSGIRVLKQDIWEMMISFIISQQKQIPSIRKCIENLCQRFGKVHNVESSKEDGAVSCADTVGCCSKENMWYGFPSAQSIASAGPDGMKGLSLGYRERYIYETAVRYLAEGISDEEISDMSYEEAKKYFCSFTGIGEKVADCICLFGAGFTDAFPIDVHVKDILYREFVSEDEKKRHEDGLKLKINSADIPRKKLLESLSYQDYAKIIEDRFSAFCGVKGIVQQWIFAYEIKS